MMKSHSGQNLAGIFPVILLTMLAACVLTVLFSGADLYGRLTERDSAAYPLRTAGQYIAVKVRQAPGEVTVGNFEGCPALIIEENAGDEVYLTRIYCYDGWLRELFSAGGMAPEDGEKLVELDSLTFEEHDGLLAVILDGRKMLLHMGEGGSA